MHCASRNCDEKRSGDSRNNNKNRCALERPGEERRGSRSGTHCALRNCNEKRSGDLRNNNENRCALERPAAVRRNVMERIIAEVVWGRIVHRGTATRSAQKTRATITRTAAHWNVLERSVAERGIEVGATLGGLGCGGLRKRRVAEGSVMKGYARGRIANRSLSNQS